MAAGRSCLRQQHAAARAPGTDPDPFVLATLGFGLAYERAVLDWFDHLPEAMTAPGPGPARAGNGQGKPAVRAPRSAER
jgi:hypothetical protein